MNTLSINIRKAIAASLLTAVLGGTSLVSLANSSNPSGGRNDAATAEVKYITTAEGQGIFKVQYINATGSRFSIQILDADGDQLYQNISTDKKFDKSFQLADPDSYHKLVFVIHNFGDNSFQRFEAEASSRLVEDVRVQEVK
jgi:hypothetical protein